MRAVKDRVKAALEPFIDKQESFNIIVDECDDPSKAGGIVNVLYNADPNKKSICLESTYIPYSLDHVELSQIVQEVLRDYKLKYKKCNGIYGDSTAYKQSLNYVKQLLYLPLDFQTYHIY